MCKVTTIIPYPHTFRHIFNFLWWNPKQSIRINLYLTKRLMRMEAFTFHFCTIH